MSVPPTTTSDPRSPAVAPRDERPSTEQAVPQQLAPVRSSGSGLRGSSGASSNVLKAGDALDAFVIVDELGFGGMGAVYLARDESLDRLVALKILPPEHSAESDAHQRFAAEAKSAARLNHENIARVYSVGRSGAISYIAFEYVEGSTLKAAVEASGPLTPAEATHVSIQLADALIHSSTRGVVHRDVKPSNIIITRERVAKLVDMGLARRFERGSAGGLTETGMTLGSFDYISPEQARDPRDVDVRSDLYSLGCTMFFMLSGRPPFPEGTVLQKLLQHQEEPAPDVRNANPAVPISLARVISKLMEKDRDRRYAVPEAFKSDLMSVSATLGPGANPAGGNSSARRRSSPSRWEKHLVWAVPASVFVVALCGLAFFNGGASVSDRRSKDPGAGGKSPTEISAEADPAGQGSRDASSSVSPRVGSIPSRPARDLAIDSGEDLLRTMIEAPPRSTILLSDDGPFLIRSSSRELFGKLIDLDLTVKADVGVRPVIRLALDAFDVPETPPKALLEIERGRLTLSGLEFEIDSEFRNEPISVIRSEDAELTISRCAFRYVGDPARETRIAAIRATVSPIEGWEDILPPRILVENSHFDGGQAALIAEGPVDVSFRDVTFAPAAGSTFVWAGAGGARETANLRLLRASVMASDGPIFKINGPSPRIHVADSLISGLEGRDTVLAESDEPSRLNWYGTDNLYARIGSFLEETGGEEGARAVPDFPLWQDTEGVARELGSEYASAKVWEEPDPLRALELEKSQPTRAFRPAARVGSRRVPGSRRGPYGAISSPARVGSRPRDEEVVRSARPRTPPNEVPPKGADDPSNTTGVASPRAADASTKSGEGAVEQPFDMEAMPLMPPSPLEPGRSATPPGRPSTPKGGVAPRS